MEESGGYGFQEPGTVVVLTQKEKLAEVGEEPMLDRNLREEEVDGFVCL